MRRALGVRLGVALCIAVLLVEVLAFAEVPASPPVPPPIGEAPKIDSGRLVIEARPVLGQASIPNEGFGEILVRISNPSNAPASGEVVIDSSGYTPDEDRSETRAPFSVGAGATVTLRIPVAMTDAIGEVSVRVVADDAEVLFQEGFPRVSDYRSVLVDVSRASALGAAIRDVPLAVRYDPWHSYERWGNSGHAVVDVAKAAYDPSTGEVILPLRVSGYTRAALVLVHSDELTRFGDAEMEALATYVLGGGTLAIVMERPEDRRHERIVALLGGELVQADLDPVALKKIVLLDPTVPPPATPPMPLGPGQKPHATVTPPGLGGPSKAIPKATDPTTELLGYSGGNLRPSAYGASAYYGLGEIHVLSFDPTERPAVDDPWVHVRMVDMLRRATDRRVATLFSPGLGGPGTDSVRRQLDPNEGTRWWALVALAILLAYSVLCGPVNFSHWRKKHEPLRALFYLPVFSLGTFMAIMIMGSAAKGCSGKSRRFTIVEAGGGMKVGTARRYRGFFVPSSRDLTVAAENASSTLTLAEVSRDEQTREQLRVDRNGLRLVDLHLRPWQTVVVREDGLVGLSDGVALVRVSKTETEIINSTGHTLKGVVFAQPFGGTGFLEEIDDGATVSNSDFRKVPPFFRTKQMTYAGWNVNDVNFYELGEQLNDASPALFEGWDALHSSVFGPLDWFPDGTPVLLAEVEGGDGATTDSGLKVDNARMLIRVVGYGGAP
ncbi:hypothetical protein JYT28_00830 [Desulfobulbus sp. AH-315-M07]|nr:hypothetical protein [Desulfobulbus sp. AH-315-M07]